MKLIHCGADENKAHEATRAKRWSDLRTCYSASTTQVWKWRGGDAIIVLGRPKPYDILPTGYAVVRRGKTVEVYEGAIKPVLERLGVKNIEIV